MGGEIADRRMTAAPVVESLDELEHHDPRLGLRLEPTPVKKLAFQRGEEALAHRIVVGVAIRTYCCRGGDRTNWLRYSP
jgi:hypothetical protein